MRNWTSSITEASDGIRLHVTRTGGEGAPVVVLHGLMGSGAVWTPLARALEGSFDVVMPDLRGHGASSAPDHGYAYEDHAGDVLALVRGLSLARPVLVGHSMGGMIAALFASLHPDLVRGVVLVDPTFLSPERQREVHASDVADQHRLALTRTKADLVAEARTRHPKRALEIVHLQVEARLRTSPHAFEVLAPPNPPYREVVRAIRAPSLLVIGDSPVVTREMAMDLSALNPRLRFEEVAHAGHGLPFEQPARLAEIVAAFLDTRA